MYMCMPYGTCLYFILVISGVKYVNIKLFNIWISIHVQGKFDPRKFDT